MKKKLLTLALTWLFHYNSLAQTSSIAPEIEKFIKSQPNICSLYYVATPDKVLSQGPSGHATPPHPKGLTTGKQQIQTTHFTESITAVGIMLLHEQKKLNLHDPILQYIPADYWPNSQAPDWANKTTIHYLLSHSSGMYSYRHDDEYEIDFQPDIDETAFKKKVLAYAVDQPLFYGGGGIMYSSSETDYFMLGMIIEHISNQTLSEFFRENLFKPLGMNDTYLPRFGKNANHPITKDTKCLYNSLLVFGDGGVITTAKDIHKWNVALHNIKIVSKASYDQMTTPHYAIDTCCCFSDDTQSMLRQLGYNKPCDEGQADAHYGYGLYIIPLAANPKEILYCSYPDSYCGEEVWYLALKNTSIILSADGAKRERETMEVDKGYKK